MAGVLCIPHASHRLNHEERAIRREHGPRRPVAAPAQRLGGLQALLLEVQVLPPAGASRRRLLHRLPLPAHDRRGHRVQRLQRHGRSEGHGHRAVGGIPELHRVVREHLLLAPDPQHAHHLRPAHPLRLPGPDHPRHPAQRDPVQAVQEDGPDHLVPAPLPVLGGHHRPALIAAGLRGSRERAAGAAVRPQAHHLPRGPEVLPWRAGGVRDLAERGVELHHLLRRHQRHTARARRGGHRGGGRAGSSACATSRCRGCSSSWSSSWC